MGISLEDIPKPESQNRPVLKKLHYGICTTPFLPPDNTSLLFHFLPPKLGGRIKVGGIEGDRGGGNKRDPHHKMIFVRRDILRDEIEDITETQRKPLPMERWR
jgi:hypothetical protein